MTTGDVFAFQVEPKSSAIVANATAGIQRAAIVKRQNPRVPEHNMGVKLIGGEVQYPGIDWSLPFLLYGLSYCLLKSITPF